ncbi:thiamine pyrophosphate-dependent enzyme [Telmatospirillum sp. J64-1]|uniref:thiamine pyrophosphate-dependent enzyme n=1 Tax=Telmatospirillum sp. J64-1 TaxID=2502183 RepID=UPI00115D2BEC|nr:thiamine pyrophosphate-dependent enzyme [Telmatospirillum sp. J64-1]
MAETASDLLVDTLIDWGVEVIFGLPGDGINGVFEALRKRQDKIRFVQVRHEEAAAFMACGYAKVTGKLGCCVATSGPGGIHLLNGLYDAKLDGVPVLAITGMQFHDLLNTHTQQDVELDKVFMDVAVYNNRVMGPAHMGNVISQACRTALARKGVAHVTIPVDIQSMPLGKDTPSKRNKPAHVSQVFAQSAGLPDESALHQAAAILNDGQKVMILAGRGAIGCTDELEQIAELLAAPIGKPLLGKMVLPDDSPYTTGGVGLLGTKPSQEALESCDTLLIIGSTFPYIEYYPKPGQARCVQIDLEAERIGLRYPAEVGLVGDSLQTLRHLIPLLQRKPDRSFLEKAQAGMKEWWELMEKRATNQSKPMKPQVVAWELGKRLKSDAIFFSDSGTIATWYARQIKYRRGQICSLSGNLATMACGLPYAIAAQVAFPARQVVALVGDGGFTMLMGEFANCVKYGLPVKIVVVNNASLGQIKWEQMVFLGNPEFACDLQPIDFAMFARACGAKGYTIDDPATCGDILSQALAEPGPVIINALVDTHEPPMPPKVSLQQAEKLAESLVRGTPDAGKIATTIMGSRAREII